MNSIVGRISSRLSSKIAALVMHGDLTLRFGGGYPAPYNSRLLENCALDDPVSVPPRFTPASSAKELVLQGRDGPFHRILAIWPFSLFGFKVCDVKGQFSSPLINRVEDM